jgi:hypothetical protein
MVLETVADSPYSYFAFFSCPLSILFLPLPSELLLYHYYSLPFNNPNNSQRRRLAGSNSVRHHDTWFLTVFLLPLTQAHRFRQ